MAYKSPDKIVYDSATGATFKEAFAEARKDALKGGPKTFEWNGKKYGTKLKGETGTSASKPQTSSVIDAGIAAGKASEGRTIPELKRQGEFSESKKAMDAQRAQEFTRNKTESDKEQKRVADLLETGTGRALLNRQEPAIKQRMASNQNVANLYKENEKQKEYSRQGNFPDAMKKGGKVKKFAAGGMASSRGDGIAQRGKTKGRMC